MMKSFNILLIGLLVAFANAADPTAALRGVVDNAVADLVGNEVADLADNEVAGLVNDLHFVNNASPLSGTPEEDFPKFFHDVSELLSYYLPEAKGSNGECSWCNGRDLQEKNRVEEFEPLQFEQSVRELYAWWTFHPAEVSPYCNLCDSYDDDDMVKRFAHMGYRPFRRGQNAQRGWIDWDCITC